MVSNEIDAIFLITHSLFACTPELDIRKVWLDQYYFENDSIKLLFDDFIFALILLYLSDLVSFVSSAKYFSTSALIRDFQYQIHL